jgi:RHH-type transcriptional regulator, rel operon repressor / antitoxin RelB
MLAIRLPEAIEKRLDALAKETGRTKSFYARQAILMYLETQEDIREAELELAKVRTGESDLASLEEMMKRYGMVDSVQQKSTSAA